MKFGLTLDKAVTVDAWPLHGALYWYGAVISGTDTTRQSWCRIKSLRRRCLTTQAQWRSYRNDGSVTHMTRQKKYNPDALAATNAEDAGLPIQGW